MNQTTTENGPAESECSTTDAPEVAPQVGEFRAELLRTMEKTGDHEAPNYRAHLENFAPGESRKSDRAEIRPGAAGR